MKPARLIILRGWNPVDTRFGLDTVAHLIQAKKADAKIIVVDPRNSSSGKALADEWIPTRPETDTALLIAVAHVIWAQGRHNADFIDTYTIGFDKFRDCLSGKDDVLAKGPESAWRACGFLPNES